MAKVRLFKSRPKKEFRLTVVERNGRKIWTCGEDLKNKAHALRMAAKWFPTLKVVDETEAKPKKKK